ncbi:MAG: nucleotidyl transferase AbiEii/AbiGii toxin family protein, partial [Eubacteriaceae bacterium]|nr:nucleotidyl transferase AbiEii/AbiGii toxin family protein [Eubacteriaceae bacterium]
GLTSFKLNVLSINRTMMEKLVSLIRMSYEPGLGELLTKTRHFYDLYLTYDLVEKFYNDAEKLVNMVELVKAAEKNSRFKDAYPYDEKWFKAPLVNIINDKKIEKAYEENFGAEFVYGELPKFELIKEKIKSIAGVLAAADL